MNLSTNFRVFIVNLATRPCYYSTKSSRNITAVLQHLQLDPESIAQAKRLRKEKAKKCTTPAHVRLHVLGTGAPGSPATLYMFTNDKRFESFVFCCCCCSHLSDFVLMASGTFSTVARERSDWPSNTEQDWNMWSTCSWLGLVGTEPVVYPVCA